MNPLTSWTLALAAMVIVGVVYLNHRTKGKCWQAKLPPVKRYWYSDDVGRVQSPMSGEKGTRWMQDGTSLSNLINPAPAGIGAAPFNTCGRG